MGGTVSEHERFIRLGQSEKAALAEHGIKMRHGAFIQLSELCYSHIHTYKQTSLMMPNWRLPVSYFVEKRTDRQSGNRRKECSIHSTHAYLAVNTIQHSGTYLQVSMERASNGTWNGALCVVVLFPFFSPAWLQLSNALATLPARCSTKGPPLQLWEGRGGSTFRLSRCRPSIKPAWVTNWIKIDL